MATVREKREQIQALISNIIPLAGETMVEYKAEIVALVVDQQYDEGISGDNKPLAPYSRAYAKRKGQQNVDYHLTGKMQSEMTLAIEGEQYEIFSETEVPGYRLSDLLQRRDPMSFDLTPENKVKAWEIIKEPFMEKVNNQLVID